MKRVSLAEKLIPERRLIEIYKGFRIGYDSRGIIKVLEDLPGSQFGRGIDLLVTPVERGGLGYEGTLEKAYRKVDEFLEGSHERHL